VAGVWISMCRCGSGRRLSPGAACRRIVFAAVAVFVCQLIAGCGLSQSGGGSSGSGGGRTPSGSASSCRGIVEFDLPQDNPNPHGATPRQALNAFLARGSVHGSAPPSLSPAKAGYPTSGWRLVKISSDTAVFASGGDKLDFMRVDNSSWVITGGSKSC
jgi:hypothetical protein